MASEGVAPEGTAAERPRDLPAPTRGAARRALAGYREHNLSLLAAALTYYGVLAAVPALVVLFTALGWYGHGLTGRVVHQVNAIAPSSSGQFVRQLLRQAQSHRAATGVTALVGVGISLWSASSYVSSFRQAANAVYEVGEGRPFWKTAPLRLGITAVAIVLLLVSAVIVVVSGSIADEVGNAIGAGHAAVVAWEVVKWPILLVVVSVLLAVLFSAAPNVRQGGVRWVTPGGVVATVGWVVASALFAVYVAEFSSYNKTYGSLASIVVFLLWLWLTNVALLFGVEINAGLEHTRAVAAGMPEDARPFVEPRDTRKLSGEDRRAAERASLLRRAD